MSTILNESDKLMWGADIVDSAYLGATKIWGLTPPPPTYTGQVARPITFGKDVRAVRKTFGVVARPVTFGKDVRATRKALGQVAFPITFGKNVQGSSSTPPAAIVLLDNFDRANGAPGSNWGVAVSTYNLPNIVSNELDWPSFPSAYWKTQFAADQGVQVKMSGAAEQVYLVLRLTSPNTGSERCYMVVAGWGGLGPVECFKWTAGAGSAVSLGFFNSIMQSTDKWVRATVVGSTISIYGSSDGVAWNLRKTWTDSAITGAGYVGVHHANNVTPGKLDNFGGGSL